MYHAVDRRNVRCDKHSLSPLPVFSWVHVAKSLIFCVVLCLCPFVSVINLSNLRFTPIDYSQRCPIYFIACCLLPLLIVCQVLMIMSIRLIDIGNAKRLTN